MPGINTVQAIHNLAYVKFVTRDTDDDDFLKLGASLELGCCPESIQGWCFNSPSTYPLSSHPPSHADNSRPVRPIGSNQPATGA